MRHSRMGSLGVGLSLALVVSWALVGVGEGPASAAVTSVQGSASGYALSVSIFNGPANKRGDGQLACTAANTPPGCAPTPATSSSPSVVLPPAGGTLTQSDADGTVGQVGPAQFFSSGRLDVTSTGTTGASGSVTSTATVASVGIKGSEAFNATTVTSSCTASGTVASGTTTITGGTLFTDSGNDTNGDGNFTGPGEHPPVQVPVPTSPAPNTPLTGHIHVNGVQDEFRIVFNEQTTGTDGAITVSVAHESFLGPTAVGELYIGRTVCGATAAAAATTTTGATATTTAPAATTAAGGGVGGGAYGYFTSVGLFGGAPAARGPAPTVTLPATGSATPITATDASATAQFGPAVIFESGKLEVSTQGTTSPRLVKSSSTVTKPGPPPFSADVAGSTCTADDTGVTGAASIANGTVITKTDKTTGDPVTTTPVPASPAPNTEIRGTLDQVGDSFRWVFNEQIVKPDGSITVNAAHEYLLGPTAVGDLIIGQSRCATTATAFTAGQNPTGTQGASAGGAILARTGTNSARLTVIGLAFVAAGLAALLAGRRRLRVLAAPAPGKPAPHRALMATASRTLGLLRRITSREEARSRQGADGR